MGRGRGCARTHGHCHPARRSAHLARARAVGTRDRRGARRRAQRRRARAHRGAGLAHATELAAADEAKLLNAPKCRNRYGFLFLRFKPGRWGAEFRILYHKTLQLLVTTALAENPTALADYPPLAIPAQLVVLGWAMYKQYVERPFAEVGSARRAFVEAHPHGDGWSRGDTLEMLSLTAQFVNVLQTGVCAFVVLSEGLL